MNFDPPKMPENDSRFRNDRIIYFAPEILSLGRSVCFLLLGEDGWWFVWFLEFGGVDFLFFVAFSVEDSWKERYIREVVIELVDNWYICWFVWSWYFNGWFRMIVLRFGKSLDVISSRDISKTHMDTKHPHSWKEDPFPKSTTFLRSGCMIFSRLI